ncbi:MAG: GNAT family N-acetyltransferase [Caldimonas sp.]
MRPISAEDRERERAFIENMSPVSRRFRFLDTMKSPSAALLTQLTDIDPATDVAFVALLARSSSATEIGVARFSARADGSGCEFAIAVGDAWQRKGLGTLLMHRLIQAAQERGIAAMHAISASDNEGMRRLAEPLGLLRMRDPEDDAQVVYRIALPSMPAREAGHTVPSDPRLSNFGVACRAEPLLGKAHATRSAAFSR